jgi:hypothetical protein
MKRIEKRGGKRKGAGRPKGKRTNHKSITLMMRPSAISKLDGMRGKIARGVYLSDKIETNEK